MIKTPNFSHRPGSPVSRRFLLGGAGAMVGLPLLASLTPRKLRAQDAACDAPKRFLAFYFSLGAVMPDWTPQGVGEDWTPSKNLTPLADLKDDILVLSGLKLSPPNPGTAHVSAVSSVLTAVGVAPTKKNLKAGISADQLIAQKLDGCTRLDSLQLGHEFSTGDEGKYSGVYGQTVSWKDENTPLRKIIQARIAFERVFDGFEPGASSAETAQRIARRRSVLDSVAQDIESIQTRLSPSDSQVLDQYLTNVRELESGLDASANAGECRVLDDPTGDDYATEVDHMGDLMAVAFQCDITRSISYMLHDGGTNRNFAFMGSPGSFHNDLSHHKGNAGKKAKYSDIVDWEMGKVARLLNALKAIDDGGGKTVLDNSLVYISSNISDGDRHDRGNLPIIVAGGGGGFKLGRHVRYNGDPQTGRLLLSMVRAFDPSVDKFGATGNSPLDQLEG